MNKWNDKKKKKMMMVFDINWPWCNKFRFCFFVSEREKMENVVSLHLFSAECSDGARTELNQALYFWWREWRNLQKSKKHSTILIGWALDWLLLTWELKAFEFSLEGREKFPIRLKSTSMKFEVNRINIYGRSQPPKNEKCKSISLFVLIYISFFLYYIKSILKAQY